MRILYVLVSDDARADALAALEDRDVEYALLDADVSAASDGGGALVQIPIPADGARPVLDGLQTAGVDVDRYTVVASGETATTPSWLDLEDEYASGYDPLPRRELRSKAMDLSQDPRTFYAMMCLSALIATVGLLADSPAVVVGSMVIAPVVGPVLTASVGTVLGDRRMLLSSLRMQAVGLVLAVLASLALSVAIRSLSLAPPVLDVSTIELIGVRLAPNTVALIVAVAAGASATLGLTTKGPMSLIGVMIAAALIPAAAASGIGFAWNRPLVGVGTLALLAFTVTAINVTSTVSLWGLGYRPEASDPAFAAAPRGFVHDADRRTVAVLVVGLLCFAAVTMGTVALTADQIAFERSANDAVVAALDDADGQNLTTVAVRSEYAATSPVDTPQTVTAVVAKTGPGNYSQLDESIAAEIASRTGDNVTVRVRFVEYQQTTARSGAIRPAGPDASLAAAARQDRAGVAGRVGP